MFTPVRQQTIMQNDLSDIILTYLASQKDESHSITLLYEQSQSQERDYLISRKNFIGHMTSSIFIVAPGKKILLLRHQKLGKLLQPGGHIDAKASSIFSATLKKLHRETGIKEEAITYRPLIPGNEDVPFYIDTHHIPEDPLTGEPAHYHHDFQYLAEVRSELVVSGFKEASTLQWVNWDEFRQLGTFPAQIPKIEQLLSKSAEHFLKAVVGKEPHKEVPVLAVSHVLPSMLGPLRFMKNNFNLLGVVVKPKSINQEVYKQLEEEGIKFLHPTREELDVAWMNETLKGVDRVILSDIGGYFAPIATQTDKLNAKILGIIEDTENGQQKYERILDKIKVPVYSVARSPLKDNEDYLVGHAVAHATDTILRQTNVLMSFGKCGVIGYGKVGQGICAYLMSMNIKPAVAEINPERLVRAYNHGCEIGEIDELLRTCDTLFCATGSQSLDIHKFRKIKNGTYIASVTSSDDEFNFEYLKGEYTIKESSDPFVKVSNSINSFYLLNGGNAVNFLFNASLGDFIYLVQAEIMKCIVTAMGKGTPAKALHKILTLSEAERHGIARLWLHEFPIKR